MKNYRFYSRRATPWEGLTNATPVEKFIDVCTKDNYSKKHTSPGDSKEVAFLNSVIPSNCPGCGNTDIIKFGNTAAGIVRYKCKSCRKTFTPITGTIFDQRKISISEWIDFLVMIIGYGSFNLTSKINRNAYSTTKYWMEKLFIILKDWHSEEQLSGTIYFDETFFPLKGKDNEMNPDGTKPRGLSRNQLCIGCAWDGQRLICIFEGYGKPSSKHTWECFGHHIKPGSTLIHDGEKSHAVLVKDLELKEEVHSSKETKGLPDNENPLYLINRQHAMLKSFLRAHSGFERSDLQDYLNFFSFIASNPNQGTLEKVKNLLELVFKNPKIHRYRR